jgi:hypothetical protein
MRIILAVVFFVIFLLLYMVFHNGQRGELRLCPSQ